MRIQPKEITEVKHIATSWQKMITQRRKRTELRLHEVMQRMLADPANKVFLIELLDQSFRSHEPSRVADQLEYLFSQNPQASIFSDLESLLILLFRRVGIFIPTISIPLFIMYLRSDVSSVVLNGEDGPLHRHLKARAKEGTRVNINIIGEMVLGEDEAKIRVKKYIGALKDPLIDYISIKISTIFSQITPIAHDYSVAQIQKRLVPIYEAAMKNRDIEGNAKFVNLDMEEYKDLELTLDVFKNTLEQEAFHSLHAGIVIQAYLPDAMDKVKELIIWAKKRVENGGAPIKVRLVKGANQEMELTEASLREWESVTYDTKAQTDANYKLILEYMLRPEHAPYVHVGLASHNLFDHAYGYMLATSRKVSDYYTAEMLEGMSEAAYEVLKEEGLNIILYAPTATAATFTNAIAYLVRRFDENTAKQNFLRHSFGLEIPSPQWDTLLKSFDDAVVALEDLHTQPKRQQNRLSECYEPVNALEYKFENESDTDFSLKANQKWAEAIAKKYKNISEAGGFHAHSVIEGSLVYGEEKVEVIDKSQFHQGVIMGSFSKAKGEEIARAITCAKEDVDGWTRKSTRERQEILMNVATEIRKRRGDLIGIVAAEVGKVFSETDVEVTEAIDFLNFYPHSVTQLEKLKGVRTTPKGVGLVVSPWNFPIAIPCGGIAASLAAGNTVIIKPASASVLSAFALCQCFWDAGVSQNTLQFIACDGAVAGEHLIPDDRVDFVIFTGGEVTAFEMLQKRPSLYLSAETGGKDATIVTALADRDQAVKNVMASAFHNSGQKCSATSLLVLEREVYEDESFKTLLVDAAASMKCGPVWELENRIGTLVEKPKGKLEKALEHLDAGETWALAPRYVDENPYVLAPSIRWGTRSGDFCHMNELFGPVLSVMCADDLDHAIEIVNSTGYGLTSGIESLDAREIDQWRDNIKAGNLYINRGTTGAIVRRQPFGGMGKSAIGSGKKAGGYNYVTQFMNLEYDGSCDQRAFDKVLNRIEKIRSKAHKESIEKVHTIVEGFAYWFKEEFTQAHDYSHIRGESNHLRYLRVKSVFLRCGDADLETVLASILAIKMVGAQLHVSLKKAIRDSVRDFLFEHQATLLDADDILQVEDDKSALEAMLKSERIRFLDAKVITQEMYQAVGANGKHINERPLIAHGRLELMHYVIEQSVTYSYHRYGNLGAHAIKEES